MESSVERHPAGPSDGELVGRVLAGDVALFEVLMRRHNQRVYRAVRSIVRNEGEVEDLMQQAWLRAYTRLPSFAGASAFSTWLLRIAVNEALGRLRRRRRSPSVEAAQELEERAGPATSDPEVQTVARETLALIEVAVDRLPETQRTVYMLRDVEELSTRECASALGISEEAVKIRLHRARSALRDTLSGPLERVAPATFTFPATRCNRVVDGVMASILRVAARTDADHHPIGGA